MLPAILHQVTLLVQLYAGRVTQYGQRMCPVVAQVDIGTFLSQQHDELLDRSKGGAGGHLEQHHQRGLLLPHGVHVDRGQLQQRFGIGECFRIQSYVDWVLVLGLLNWFVFQRENRDEDRDELGTSLGGAQVAEELT
uniref:(northern house mosquito) hypothetical protein n=1 Tax=Culex pipiens TaxID=7175 RepID=A0A8D8FQ63_CULPI